MSRQFATATSEYLEIDTPAFTAYPFTMACWFNVTNITASHVLMWVGDKDVVNYMTFLAAQGSTAGDPVIAFSHEYGVGPTGTGRADTSTSYSANTWHHACGTWSGVSNRTAYLDGGGKVTNTDAVIAMSNHDRTAIGAARDSSPGAYVDGLIAEAAIWDVTLTDAEVAVLAAGYAPPFVRPQNLVFYIPLVRNNDEDIVGGLSLTAFNTPTIGTHPRIIYPAAPFMIGQTPTVVFALHGKTFLYTAANWPTLSWYLEADMRATTGTARARLWDVTAGAAVASSDITTTSTTFTQVRSSAVTLTDAHEYRIQYGTFPGDNGETRGATLIGI